MEVHVPAAGLLGRTLLRLGEARSTGTLNVLAPPTHRATIALHAGRVAAVAVDGGPLLGDLLPIDLEAHRRALERGATRPVGRWLVREGLASAPSVSHALRRQARARVTAVFAWPEVVLRYAPPAAPLTPLDEPLEPVDLVLGALRTHGPLSGAAETRLRGSMWVLSARGRALLPNAALYPQERAMLVALARGVRGDDAIAIGGQHPRAIQGLHAWHQVGLVVDPRLEAERFEGRHQALLRARRKVRRGTASIADHRELRRTLRDVHPDRFDPRLHETCNEVLRALLTARAETRRAG